MALGNEQMWNFPVFLPSKGATEPITDSAKAPGWECIYPLVCVGPEGHDEDVVLPPEWDEATEQGRDMT